jgi:hypothetical protein
MSSTSDQQQRKGTGGIRQQTQSFSISRPNRSPAKRAPAHRAASTSLSLRLARVRLRFAADVPWTRSPQSEVRRSRSALTHAKASVESRLFRGD